MTREVVSVLVAAVAGAVIGGSCMGQLWKSSPQTIPHHVKQVQEGYAQPSQLEIRCEDLDGNGVPETYLQYGAIKYHLIEVNGRPKISAYRPGEIVLKE